MTHGPSKLYPPFARLPSKTRYAIVLSFDRRYSCLNPVTGKRIDLTDSWEHMLRHTALSFVAPPKLRKKSTQKQQPKANCQRVAATYILYGVKRGSKNSKSMDKSSTGPVFNHVFHRQTPRVNENAKLSGLHQ